MQEAMQLMFGQDGNPLPYPMQGPLDTAVQQSLDMLSNKPAVMQRLSVLARAPADSPSYRPFNMLASPDTSACMLQTDTYSAQLEDQSSAAGVQYGLPQALPDAADGFGSIYAEGGVGQTQLSQLQLSMAALACDTFSAQQPWLNSADSLPSARPPANGSVKKDGKHGSAASGKHSRSKSRHFHANSRSAKDSKIYAAEPGLQPEFSFSPLGDSSSRIEAAAFSPLAVGAGQLQARPSVAQRIRKSLFGPAKGPGQAADSNSVKVGLLLSFLLDSVLPCRYHMCSSCCPWIYSITGSKKGLQAASATVYSICNSNIHTWLECLPWHDPVKIRLAACPCCIGLGQA